MEMDKIPCEKGKRLYDRTLAMLSRGKGTSIFEQLVEEEVGVIEKEMLSAKDNDGFTLLHHAARCNKAKTVILLLDNGAEIDILGNYGLTALHIAVRYDTTV